MEIDKNRERVDAIIEYLQDSLFNMQSIMEDKKIYREFIEQIYDYLKAGFEHKDLRDCPVYFKFNPDGEIHTLQLRHFLTNLIFWEPMLELECQDKLNENYIVDATRISSDYIKDYIDKMIVVPFRKKISNKRLNKLLHDLIYNLSRISTDFNIILGLSMNIESFIDVANKNERFNEIIRTKLDPSWQPSQIESELNKLMNEEIQILMTEDNALKPILRAGAGIKHKQLSEFSISGGLKPDLAGNTIPKPIDSNLVVGGLNSVSNYFIDSIGKYLPSMIVIS